MSALVQRIPRYENIPESTAESLPLATLARFADALRQWSCDLSTSSSSSPAAAVDFYAWDDKTSDPQTDSWRRECGLGIRGGRGEACTS